MQTQRRSYVDCALEPEAEKNDYLILDSSVPGQPVLVEVSLSLRNILEIDEHKQVS